MSKLRNNCDMINFRDKIGNCRLMKGSTGTDQFITDSFQQVLTPIKSVRMTGGFV